MARKKKGLGIFLIAIILIASVVGIIYFVRQVAVGGTTFLSISNIDIIDVGQRIRIYGVAGVGAEEIRISFGSEEISDLIQDEGYKATKGISGRINLEKQIKKFMLIKQSDENFLRLKSKDIGRFTLCSSSSCEDKKPYGYIHNNMRFRSPTLVCVCLYERNEGTNAIFTGQEIEDSEISINIGGASGTLKPAQGFNTITLNDGRTKVEWVGSLNNYNQIHAPNYNVLFKASQYDRLISPNAYSNYRNEVDNFGECIGAGSNFFINYFLAFGRLLNLPSVATIDNCVTSFNNKLDTILIDRTLSYENAINAEDVYFTSNSMDVDLKTVSVFPTFIITLDAESVGLVELIGEPDIVSCVPTTTIKSGDTISTSLRVRNKGQSDGSFYGNIMCTGGNVNGYITEVLVGAGQTTNLPIQLSGSRTTPGIDTASCVFTIIDRKSGNSDSCTSSIKVEYEKGFVCEPGTDKCIDADTLRKCNTQGTDYEDINCEFGCVVLSGGVGKCATEEGIPPDEAETCYAQCDADHPKIPVLGKAPLSRYICYVGCFMIMVRWIAAILIGLFSFLIILNLFKKRKVFKKKEGTRIIISLIIGGLIGVFAYFLFWIALITFIVLLIIWIALPAPARIAAKRLVR